MGEYCAEYVDGFQRSPLDDGAQLQASAVCKHYLANELEYASPAITRHTIDVSILNQDLVDSYLPPFQSCVQKGKVSGLMCSYNSVRALPKSRAWRLLRESSKA